METVSRSTHMQHDLTVSFGPDQAFRFTADASMSSEAARRWLDEQFLELDCEPIRASGKVLVAEAPCKAVDCPKTVDACLSQITAGLAWWYRDYAREQSGDDAQRYRLAEEDARSRNVGLWAGPEPIPPWDWRTAKKQP